LKEYPVLSSICNLAAYAAAKQRAIITGTASPYTADIINPVSSIPPRSHCGNATRRKPNAMRGPNGARHKRFAHCRQKFFHSSLIAAGFLQKGHFLASRRVAQ
jgi:hypothetical protein